MMDFKRICAGSDTVIFIVGKDTDLCTTMLDLLRAPGMLSPSAAAVFETGWSIYEKQYAADGGAFGALIHRWLKKRGPVLAMGHADQVPIITRMLILKARSITRRDLTPTFADRIFEAAATAVSAELSATEGNA